MVRVQNESGTAVIESVILGIVLILPTIWLLSVLGSVHSAALATNSAVREAGAVVSSALDAPRDLDALAEETLRNHGLDPAAGGLEVSAPDGFTRGAAVHIAISYRVAVFDPPFLGARIGPAVTVRSRHIARIDPYRSR